MGWIPQDCLANSGTLCRLSKQGKALSLGEIAVIKDQWDPTQRSNPEVVNLLLGIHSCAAPVYNVDFLNNYCHILISPSQSQEASRDGSTGWKVAFTQADPCADNVRAIRAVR